MPIITSETPISNSQGRLIFSPKTYAVSAVNAKVSELHIIVASDTFSEARM